MPKFENFMILFTSLLFTMAVFAYWNVAVGAQELEEQGYIEFLGLQITDPAQMKLVLLLPLLAGIAILCFYVTGQLW